MYMDSLLLWNLQQIKTNSLFLHFCVFNFFVNLGYLIDNIYSICPILMFTLFTLPISVYGRRR